jgi:hypothetical protein
MILNRLDRHMVGPNEGFGVGMQLLETAAHCAMPSDDAIKVPFGCSGSMKSAAIGKSKAGKMAEALDRKHRAQRRWCGDPEARSGDRPRRQR